MSWLLVSSNQGNSGKRRITGQSENAFENSKMLFERQRKLSPNIRLLLYVIACGAKQSTAAGTGLAAASVQAKDGLPRRAGRAPRNDGGGFWGS